MIEIESNFVKFEVVGDVVEGVIKKLDDITFAGKNGLPPTFVGKYELTDDDGITRTVHGSATLDTKLANVPDGAYVRIEYVADGATSGGNKLKQFKVQMEEA